MFFVFFLSLSKQELDSPSREEFPFLFQFAIPPIYTKPLYVSPTSVSPTAAHCTSYNTEPLIRTNADVHGSVRHNTNLIEMTNKMQLCRTIYYSIVP